MESDVSARPKFADYARPVLQRKWLILVAVVVATGGVYGFYATQPKEYTAGTLVYAATQADPVSITNTAPDPDRSLQNQAALLYSEGVAGAVKQRIGYVGTSTELLQSVKVEARPGKDIIEISARAGNPKLVADIVNGYAGEFVARSNGAQRNRIQEAAQLARQQRSRIPATAETRSTRAELDARIRALDLALSVPATPTRQVDEAKAPSAAAAPKPERNAMFAFVLSLISALCLAFGLERFDRRLKQPEEVTGAYGLPLLAMVPHSPVPTPVESGVSALSPDLRESFRALRTNIELTNLDHPPRTILVASGIHGEGKSTVARNLALAFCETGKRVAIIEGDLRRPSLADMFGQDRDDGFTEILGGKKRLEDVAIQAPTRVPGIDDLLRMQGAPVGPPHNGSSSDGSGALDKLTLLLSGASPANPPTVLTSLRAREVLDEVALSHDITIIDSAPLLSVTDSVPLLRYADAVLIVGRLGYTTRDTAKRVSEFLDRVPDVNPIGVLANDLTRLEALGYGQAYGYGYGDEETRQMTKENAAEPKRSDQAV